MRVILLCGPPCAGKTTLAEQLAQPGDQVLDLDIIARELGSPARWVHPEPYRTQAEQRIRELMRQLPGTGPGTAYVIRSLPNPQHRAITAKMIKAIRCIVLNPGQAECIRRATVDGRPPTTVDAIADWYNHYRSWSGDTQSDHVACSPTRHDITADNRQHGEQATMIERMNCENREAETKPTANSRRGQPGWLLTNQAHSELPQNRRSRADCNQLSPSPDRRLVDLGYRFPKPANQDLSRDFSKFSSVILGPISAGRRPIDGPQGM